MKKPNTVLLPLLLLWAALLAGQTPISGVINRYTSVTAIDTCEARLTVTSTVFFQPGQSVLVMQMQGAAINQSNSGAFGDLIDPGCAGCWEKARIKAVTGTDIFLENLLVNTYDPAGGVQLVSLPTFEDARVEGTLTALPWNGSMGGVLALEVTDSLLLEADLDVSGLGFRGGQVHEVESDCSWLTNADDYHYSFNNWRGAPKGEGLARIIAGKEAGRGPQANGGGGGNDHNTGGGGGANRTSGGRGGKYKAEGTFTCKGDHPGLGGKPAPDRPDRIFFGGGGGAGHVNNSGAGTRGGNGGGIVIVLAKTIVGNGHKIIANGEHPGTGNGDGGGGGGGGGSIALQAQNVEGLSVEARGGNGADVNNDPGRCYGPGGGGAGGLLLKGFAGTLPSLLDGGQPGRNLTPSNQCTDPTHGATPGQDGVRTSWEGPLAGTEPVAPFAVIFQPESATGCEENQVSFEFVVHGTALQYQWQRWTGSTWEDMVNTPDIAGTKTSILTLFNLRTDQNGERFRCRVGSDCDGTHFSQEVTLSVEPLPVPAFDFQTLGDNRLRFDNLSQNASSYAWDFGDGNTSTEANPEHQYALAGTYTVTLEAFNDCGSRILERSVQVQAAPIAQFGVHYTPACAPVQVLFEDQSANEPDSLLWLFPGGEPATSSLPVPLVSYPAPGVYDVTLIALNDSGADTLRREALIEVLGPPQVGFVANITGLVVKFTNTTSNADSYLWDFGDGSTSTETSPNHEFPEPGVYLVTLTAENECGAQSFSLEIATGDFPQAAFSSSQTTGCAPLTVRFSDHSKGSNISAWQWSFPGGQPASSTLPNPEVTYPTPGTYDVELTVSNALGSHTLRREALVQVVPFPEADFSYEELDTFTIAFTNLSTPGLEYTWDFGDGSPLSHEVDPVHVYARGGSYDVTLSVSNGLCGASIVQGLYMLPVATTEVQPYADMRVFPNPFTRTLTIRKDEALGGALRLRLFGPAGRLFFQGQLRGLQQLQLDTGAFPAGMYILEVTGPHGMRAFRLLKAGG